MSTELIVVLAIVVVLLLVLISIYNGLINKKNQIENVFGSLDALLKKRYDLIPNLISSVQEYMKYESGTLTEITQIRTKAMSPSISSEEKIELANQLSSAMRGINVAFENYPELKANQNFLQLQGSLNEVEEQISAARRTYNAVVTDYNNGVEMFPSNIIASLMGLKKKPVFVIEESERKNVDVKGLFNK